MALDVSKPKQPDTNIEETTRTSGRLAGSGRSYLAHGCPWLLRLALLTVAVFAVHLALLNSSSLSLNLRPSMPSAAFTTRTILLPDVVQPAPTQSKVNKPAPVAPVLPKPKQIKPPISPQPTAIAPVEAAVTPAPQPETPPEPIKQAEVVPTPAHTPEPVTVPSPAPTQSNETAAAVSGEPAAAFSAPLAAKYIYNVTFTKNANSNKGTAELSWQHDGAHYVLSLTASYFGIPVFTQSSAGQLAPQGLLPYRFSDKRFRKSEVAAHFNHPLGKITFSANTPDAVLLAGAQDRVSVILQLAGLLAADPAKYPPGATFNLQTISATEAEPWLFTVNEPETLNLPAGPQIALRITRNPRREFDQKVELWFAPELNYAPVRFRFTETNGDYVDAQLQSSQYLSPLKPN